MIHIAFVAPFAAYEFIKYWLPAVTIISLIVKAYLTAKKNIGAFCDKLLTNHLFHIESAVTNTAQLTKETNGLLVEHYEKQAQVWESVAKTLAILEDRTASRRRYRKK